MSSPTSWSWILALRLRSRNFSASWLLRRAERRQARLQKRLALLEREVDSTLLALKEQDSLVLMASHRLAEMADSRDHRELGILPPVRPSLPPELPQTHLQRLLQESTQR